MKPIVTAPGEKKQKPPGIITAWGKVAEIAEKFLTKGKEVAIEGKLVNRTYNDKEGTNVT
jgi:single-stranded DNA-binding protein